MHPGRRWWILVTLFALMGGAVAFAQNGGEIKKTRTPLPVVTIYKGEKCVEPTEIMRRDHMNFILHQRDETVHKGLRTTRHSLKKCVNCHADPETSSVMGENGFCQSCHTYAAVSMDCFGCHTPLAEEDAKALANHPPGNPNDKHLERILTSTSFTPLNTRLQEPKP